MTAVVQPLQPVTLNTNIPVIWRLISIVIGIDGSSVDTTLITPSGASITPQTLPVGAAYLRGQTFEQYLIPDAEPGTWQVNVYGTDLPAGPEPVNMVVEGCMEAAGDSAGDPCSFDDDADGLSDGDEVTTYLTDPLTYDTDGDNCSDGTESLGSPSLGGDRDPLDFWDFFDVTGDQTVDLSDTLDVLTYFGDAGTSTAGNLRDRDNFGAAQPWQTYESNDGVDLTDALVNLQSFGHDCSGPP